MKKLIALLLILTFCLPMAACGLSSQQQQEVIDAFKSLPYTDEYVFCKRGEIFIGDRIVDIGDIDCGGAYLEILFCEADGVYGYYTETVGSLAICNIVCVDYETLTPTLISRLVLQDYGEGCAVFVRENTIYVRDFYKVDGDRKLYYHYYVCDLSTRVFEKVEDEEKRMEIEESILSRRFLDNGRSLHYEIEGNDTNPFVGSFKITNKETGEIKYVTSIDFQKWAKGKIPHVTYTYCIDTAYEKDGDIYLVGAVEVGYMGYPCYVFIMKYDFAKDALEYYTSFYSEHWVKTKLHLYIP